MAGRTRTTKKLAQRINLDYFKTLRGIPRWRRILSGAFVIGGPGVARLVCAGGKPEALQRRPAGARARVAGTEVRRVPCLAGELSATARPIRRVWRVTMAPSITRTKRSRRPARVAMWSIKAHFGWPAPAMRCTQCHADLKTTHGASKFASNIRGFDRSHPEFAALRPGASDPGTIKFNHRSASERGSARTERPGAVEVRRLPSAAGSIARPSVHGAGQLREALRRLATRCSSTGASANRRRTKIRRWSTISSSRS